MSLKKKASDKNDTNCRFLKYNHSLKGRYRRLIARAKKKKVEMEIDFELYKELLARKCFYCNDELAGPNKDGVGLDRVDSDGGYTKSNVVKCCGGCNWIKGRTLTAAETVVAVSAVLRFREEQKKSKKKRRY